MDKSTLLLPRDKYTEAEKKYGHGSAMLEINNGKQVLFYFGANHSRNPADPQYSVLKEYWNKFLEVTKGRDRIVLVEGSLRPLIEDEEKAIINGSEGNLITLFAHRMGIPVICPDISNEKLLNNLPNLNKEEVLLYWFLSWLNNFQKHADPKPDFDKSVKVWCENQKSKEIWKNIEISLPKLKELYKNILGEDFNENKNPNSLVNPNKIETPINKVARTLSDLRDKNIVEEITRYWSEGKSIFVVFGRGHLIIQEPALKKLLK